MTAREMLKTKAEKPTTDMRVMQATANRPEYLGALLEDRSRLVLVSVDPEQPWEAFKRLRRQLRKEAHKTQPIVDIFEAPVALERKPADVISLDARRRAG